MQVRLIDDDEAPIKLPIGDSTLWVRRLSQAKRRGIAADVRRGLNLSGRAGSDREATIKAAQEIEDRELDAMIERWEGIPGDPPCTRENKAKLPDAAKIAVRVLADSVGYSDEETGLKNVESPSSS